jgi:hypothetical protein
VTVALPLAVNDGRADQREHYGHVEPMSVHFDDIDSMGVVHNVR